MKMKCLFFCFSDPISTLSLNDIGHPILPQMISFNLIMSAMCDIYSIAYILHCMPNLNRFNFSLAGRMAGLPYYRELFNGYVWQQILERNSFQYFVRKYPNWNMVIDRWRLVGETPGK